MDDWEKTIEDKSEEFKSGAMWGIIEGLKIAKETEVKDGG